MMKYLMAFMFAAAAAIVFGMVIGTIWQSTSTGVGAGLGWLFTMFHTLVSGKKDNDDDYPCK